MIILKQTHQRMNCMAKININTDGFSITIRFYKQHLDMSLTKTNGLTIISVILGQFLTADVKIDTENMIMKLSDCTLISVTKDKAWPFLGTDEGCWYGANTDNQGPGHGVIGGRYIDYVVEQLIAK